MKNNNIYNKTHNKFFITTFICWILLICWEWWDLVIWWSCEIWWFFKSDIGLLICWKWYGPLDPKNLYLTNYDKKKLEEGFRTIFINFFLFGQSYFNFFKFKKLWGHEYGTMRCCLCHHCVTPFWLNITTPYLLKKKKKITTP